MTYPFDFLTTHGRGWVASAALAFAAACTAGGPVADATAPRTAASSALPAKAASAPRAVDASKSTVQALIGDAVCESDAQCDTIAVGAKACGGPEAYLPWSSLRTDATALQAAAAREAAAARGAVSARGMVSNCAMVVDPGAYCAPAAAAPSAASAAAAPRVCRLRSTRLGRSAVY
jgi:hypothetical protein